MDTYIQGESIELNILIKNEDGVIIDLDTFQTISISVYNAVTNIVLKNGTKADGDITYSTAASGIISFFIEDGLTATATKGRYHCLLTVTQTDTQFDDNTDTGKYIAHAFILK